MGGKRGTPAERFWRKVDRKGPNDCWPWQAQCVRGPKPCDQNKPYGRFSVTESVSYQAHRYAWILTRGPIPKGMVVTHRCDNRLCVNPRHLKLGTQIDNIEDMKRKGRQCRGVNKPDAKLTEDDVRSIRAIHASGILGYKKLGELYGISDVATRYLIKRWTWRHVA